MNVTISYFLHVQVSYVYKYISGTNYMIWYNYLSYKLVWYTVPASTITGALGSSEVYFSPTPCDGDSQLLKIRLPTMC